MITKQHKNETIKNIREHLEKSNAIFVTNLIGIQSNEAVAIRKKVRECNGHLLIARNTLFKKASIGTPFADVLGSLKGPNAVAFAYGDVVSVAKVVVDAGKDFEIVKLKSGWFEGREMKVAEVNALAELPSRDQLLAMVLASFNAPVSAFVRVLDAIRKKKEEVSASA